MDSQMKLSDHFKIYEMVRSSTATRLEIDNTPAHAEIERAMLLGEKCLEPIRDKFGPFGPNSWFRGEVLEKVITKKSYTRWAINQKWDPSDDGVWAKYFSRKSHPKGEAADIEIIGVDNEELFQWIQDNLEFDQCIREFGKPNDPTSGWVHISYKEKDNRQSTFRIP